MLEGVAELRCPTAKPVKAAAGEVAHVGCEWELLLPLSRSGGKVKGKGKLRVSGNARALWLRNLSFESRFDPFSQEVSEVQPPHHQFGFCKVPPLASRLPRPLPQAGGGSRYARSADGLLPALTARV